MKFSIGKIIFEIAKELNISKETGGRFISGELGTRWILERDLSCSEVELGMLLKSIRKRLSYKFQYRFFPQVTRGKGITLFNRLSKHYRNFDILHQQFFEGENYLPKIKKTLLAKRIIVDSGISNERFFQLLPKVLRKMSPEELNLCFIINTLLRWKIAFFLQSKIGVDLYARGSLIFLNARPFGCGYSANFPHEKQDNEFSSTYLPLQGSDLDLKIKNRVLPGEIYAKISGDIKEIRNQLLRYKTFLTIEITNFDKNYQEDVWLVQDLPVLAKFIKQFLYKSPHKRTSNFFGKDKVPIGELKERNLLTLKRLGHLNIKGKIRLTKTNIEKLELAFKKMLRYYKTNKDFITKYSARWKKLLERAKRETDFYGFISETALFFIFQHLFFLSGLRFSEQEEKELFRQVLKKYEEAKI